MKKVFTLFVSFVMVAVSFAQYNQGNENGYGNNKERNAVYNDRFKKDGDRDRNDRRNNWKRERDMQIMQINREYDRKIESVRSRWFMNRSKKERLIYQLEDQRRSEIRNVYERFNNQRGRFNDDDHRDHGRRDNDHRDDNHRDDDQRSNW